MKRWGFGFFALELVIVLCIGALLLQTLQQSGSGEKEEAGEMHFVLIVPAQDSEKGNVRESVEQLADRYRLDIEFHAFSTVAEQKQMLRVLPETNVDGVLLWPISVSDDDYWEELTALRNVGIPVVVMERDVAQEVRSSFVGSGTSSDLMVLNQSLKLLRDDDSIVVGNLSGSGNSQIVELLFFRKVPSREVEEDLLIDKKLRQMAQTPPDVYQPVQRLTSQAEKIMECDYQMEDLPVAQQDEIGQLTEAFNAMKNRVRENFQNREELWRLESLLQDAEFRALQSQVNPHFLFNVLSVATEAALLENADRTVDIIEHISYMLHYGLTSVREDSWLADELKMVRSYLFLQKERFGDRIAFLDSTPEELPVMRIPGMTLQPIVENAVKHGVERMTAGGKIEITLRQTPEAVEVCVEDNGCGIPQEKVDALNRGETVRGDSRSTGLGIANVRSRMAIFYKQEGLLKVESRDGEGTKVCLKYLVQEEI